MNLYSSYCELCPRKCGADRAAGQRGDCGATDQLRVARAALHFWEEPPVSGWRGSGTVFFSHCPLRCVYCQNYEISSGGAGQAITTERLAEIFLELQDQGAHNINLVTATQYVPAVAAALRLVRPESLHIPVIFNTSGYELPYTLHRLDGLVDGYLFDVRYSSPELARRYSRAEDYPQVAVKALEAAVEQVGPYTVASPGRRRAGSARPTHELEIDAQYPGTSRSTRPTHELEINAKYPGAPGRRALQDTIGYNSSSYRQNSGAQDPAEVVELMTSGVIIRQLLLPVPGGLDDSLQILRSTFARYGNTVCYSLMNQYTPMPQTAQRYPELARPVTEADYSALVDAALELGVTHSFMQEGGAVSESFIPPFDNTGV
ncbi:MAG: radical SAM protein [Coriobacteriia bacterium]|nr:radical SAM protein [Coriobacteriia bacterium]